MDLQNRRVGNHEPSEGLIQPTDDFISRGPRRRKEGARQVRAGRATPRRRLRPALEDVPLDLAGASVAAAAAAASASSSGE